MAKLQSPQNVTVTLATNGTTLTVAFKDPNLAASVASYDIQFLLRTDTSQTVAAAGTPFLTSATNVSNSSGKVTITGITAGSKGPAVTALPTTYVASVVAKASASTDSDSDPGLSTYWDVGGTVYLQIGSQNLTLTADSTSAGSGVYRLPVSTSNPLTITFAEVETFVQSIATAIGLPSFTLPSQFPDGTPTNSVSLSLEKLAFDKNNGLFSLEVSAAINWSPFTGLTVQKLGLTVLRTNGQDQL